MKVAIQGELGSFSHEAAERMLPRCTVAPCARSAEVFDRLERGSVNAAVIPIENTLAGTVAEHADLMLTREGFIQGEYLLNALISAISTSVSSLGDSPLASLADCTWCLMSSTISGLARVVTSPVSVKLETAAITRRMIFPDRVFGMSGTIHTFLGRAILPISTSMARVTLSAIS